MGSGICTRRCVDVEELCTHTKCGRESEDMHMLNRQVPGADRRDGGGKPSEDVHIGGRDVHLGGRHASGATWRSQNGTGLFQPAGYAMLCYDMLCYAMLCYVERSGAWQRRTRREEQSCRVGGLGADSQKSAMYAFENLEGNVIHA